MKHFTIAMILAGVIMADQVTVTYDNDERMLVKPEDIPISIRTDVNVPTVDVPSVEVPTVEIPEPEVPEVTTPSTKEVYMVEKAVDSFPATGYVIAMSGTTNTLGGTATSSGNITDDVRLTLPQEELHYIPESLSPLNIASYYVPESVSSLNVVPYYVPRSVSLSDVSPYYVPKSVSRYSVPFYYVPQSISSLSIASYYVPKSANGLDIRTYYVPKSDDPTDVETYYIPDTATLVGRVDIDTGKVSASDYGVGNEGLVKGTEITEFAKEAKDFMLAVRDRRSFQNDPLTRDVNGYLLKWKKIYATFADYTPEYVPLPSGIRMIAEARVPNTSNEWEILKQNLSYYRKAGYTSVLVTFSDEDPEILQLFVSFIRNAEMDVYFAYSGAENLSIPVFRDPERLRRQILTIAPMAKGMLLAWRRTSAHLFLQDAPFTNYLMKCARDGNSTIALIGEGYYGETSKTNLRHNHLTYIMPANVSGCALVGVGTSNINAERVVSNLFADVNVPKLAVILGPKVYYETRNRTNILPRDMLNAKKRLENRFLAAGCTGTITLHGDGSDGVYNQSYTDNISTSLINN